VHERGHRRHTGIAYRLQYGAIVREGFIAPDTGLGLEPRPRKREAEHHATQAARKLDVFAIAIPEVGGFPTRNDLAHALPYIADVVVLVVGLALMVGSCDAEPKSMRHVLQMREIARASLPGTPAKECIPRSR
jgi:hypothetical protein